MILDLKIQSVSDIITNSSSEVFIEKIDDHGLIDKVLETLELKDYFKYFRTEDDIKKWFINVIEKGDDLEIWDDVIHNVNSEDEDTIEYPYNMNQYALQSLCNQKPTIEDIKDFYFSEKKADDPFYIVDYSKIDEIITNWIPRKPEELWEKHKQYVISKMLGKAFAYLDRDEWYELNEKHKDEVNKLYYEDSLKYPVVMTNKFKDIYGNVLNIGDYVILAHKNTHKFQDGPAEFRMSKLKDIKLREDGKYDVTFEIFGANNKEEKFLTYKNEYPYICQAIKDIPNELFGTIMHDDKIPDDDIYRAAHEEYGFSKLSSNHAAFIKGAQWAISKLYKKYSIF